VNFFNKSFDPADIRASIIAALSIKVEEPVFESQTKTKLGSRDMGPSGPSVAKYISDFLKKDLDDYLHKHPTSCRDHPKKKFRITKKNEKRFQALKSLPASAQRRQISITRNYVIVRFI
jgi:topoisomerase-4 subunit B